MIHSAKKTRNMFWKNSGESGNLHHVHCFLPESNKEYISPFCGQLRDCIVCVDVSQKCWICSSLYIAFPFKSELSKILVLWKWFALASFHLLFTKKKKKPDQIIFWNLERIILTPKACNCKNKYCTLRTLIYTDPVFPYILKTWSQGTDSNRPFLKMVCNKSQINHLI